jgi:hypothetical protein
MAGALPLALLDEEAPWPPETPQWVSNASILVTTASRNSRRGSSLFEAMMVVVVVEWMNEWKYRVLSIKREQREKKKVCLLAYRYKPNEDNGLCWRRLFNNKNKADDD